MQPVLKSKQPKVGTTIFTVMSKMAHDYGAINLSQGYPNFDCDEKLKELVCYYTKKGYNQYPPMAGVMAFRESLAEKVSRHYQVDYHPETEVTITSGATESIYAAITAVVCSGDEVIIFEPAYDCYAPTVELNGGKPVFITLEPPTYQIDWGKVKNAINPKTKLIIINTPHNPTGTVLSPSDLESLAQIVKDKAIFLLSDEVYEHIIFDGKPHQSLMLHPTLKERTFVTGSFGKTFHVTGWKIGYCLAPKQLTEEFRKVHQWLTFTTITPVQYALAEYLKAPENYIHIPEFYQKKRNIFNEALKASRFEFTPSSGSFFQNVNYAKITDEFDQDLSKRWTKEIGVASIPVSVFYHQQNDFKVLRFCFAKDEETLKIAAEKLCKI
ncbi:MAG: methionine aminotransferase [Flammeovirgaceae bacterium]|nr:methionine aminotransferase [Flammeovirgaceae bacterium]